MGVTVEHNTGDPELQRDVVAIIEHVLSDRPGDRRVSIIGSRGSDGGSLCRILQRLRNHLRVPGSDRFRFVGR